MRRHRVYVCHDPVRDASLKKDVERRLGLDLDFVVGKPVDQVVAANTPDPDIIQARLRDYTLLDSTVTLVLIGATTFQRRQVDWEIAASLRDSPNRERSGVLGLLLPTYPKPWGQYYSAETIPPRLADNLLNGYATVHPWSTSAIELGRWIHEAWMRRERCRPNNSRPLAHEARPDERRSA